MKNSVTVQLESNLQYFGRMDPIEIRNGRMKLIGTLQRGGSIELDDGVYEISAVLEDGQKHSQLVHLQGRAHQEVTLGVKTELQMVPASSTACQRRSLGPPGEMRIGWTKGVPSRHADPALARVEPDPLLGATAIEGPIKFLEATGAVLRGLPSAVAGEITWRFAAKPNPVAVPCARFSILGRKIAISLPVNPKGGFAENTCDVVTIINAGKPEVRAWISRERTVARSIQQMVASGYLLQAAEIAGEATELLRDKYRDPTGALLGALLLNKIGQLESRLTWVENLARDFSWLEDAKVLLAMLFSKEKARQEEAFLLAIGAVEKRMMFTETYSLLLNLLRRWPCHSRANEALHAAAALVEVASMTNWDSMMFYDSNIEEE